MADPMALERVSQVKKQCEAQMMAKKNVVGLGIGFKARAGVTGQEMSLVIYVSQKLPDEALDPKDRIPSFIEGIPTDVIEVGKIRAW